MTLLKNWRRRIDVTGWFWSEKFDGCRAFWDGFNLWTRGGLKIDAPKWFTDGLPAGFRLDGEIWAGRGRFEQARQAVQNGRFTKAIRFKVFDAPREIGRWDKRMAAAEKVLRGSRIATAVSFGTIKDFDHLQIVFFSVWGDGGEGIVLRNPATTIYEKGRTNNCLRIKKDPFWGY